VSVTTALEILLAPLLVGVASLVARRWHAELGGVVSAFPAIVGPVLLIVADRQGEAAAARAATGSLLGIVAFCGFVVAYGRATPGHGWPFALACGWGAAALLAPVAGRSGASVEGAFCLAVASLIAARVLLPRSPAAAAATASTRVAIGMRMASTVVLVAALAFAAGHFGALAGGVASSLPALMSVLAVATHRHGGGAEVVRLLRGALAGMVGFVVFCVAIAWLVVPLPTSVTFTLAGIAAVLAQSLTWRLVRGAGESRAVRCRRRRSVCSRHTVQPSSSLRAMAARRWHSASSRRPSSSARPPRWRSTAP
jgi:hypothetical protein